MAQSALCSERLEKTHRAIGNAATPTPCHNSYCGREHSHLILVNVPGVRAEHRLTLAMAPSPVRDDCCMVPSGRERREFGSEE